MWEILTPTLWGRALHTHHTPGNPHCTAPVSPAVLTASGARGGARGALQQRTACSRGCVTAEAAPCCWQPSYTAGFRVLCFPKCQSASGSEQAAVPASAGSSPAWGGTNTPRTASFLTWSRPQNRAGGSDQPRQPACLHQQHQHLQLQGRAGAGKRPSSPEGAVGQAPSLCKAAVQGQGAQQTSVTP